MSDAIRAEIDYRHRTDCEVVWRMSAAEARDLADCFRRAWGDNDAAVKVDAVLLTAAADEVDPCNGSSRCRATTHTHGCYADKGDCDDPLHRAPSTIGGGPR